MRKGAAFNYQSMMQNQDPKLQSIIEVRNNTAELDIDLMLEQSFDVVNIQNEQFQTLAQFAQSSKDIDIIELIELSQLRDKEKLIEKIEKRRSMQSQANGDLAQAEAQEREVKNAKIYADAQVSSRKAEQMAIENELLSTTGDKNPQVII